MPGSPSRRGRPTPRKLVAFIVVSSLAIAALGSVTLWWMTRPDPTPSVEALCRHVDAVTDARPEDVARLDRLFGPAGCADFFDRLHTRLGRRYGEAAGCVAEAESGFEISGCVHPDE